MSAPRRSRRPLSVIAISTGVFLAALAAGSGPVVAQGPPEEVLSHMLCYRGTFAQFDRVPGIGLQDQFAGYNATVGAPRLLCNPAKKTRRSGVTRIVDRRQHLKAYRVGTPQVTGTIDLLDSNQFGREQGLIIDRTPTMLLVPTRKAPHDPPVGLDHFLCYPVVQGQAIDKPVALRDQFGSFRTRVGKPKLHCNPTAKFHPPNPPATVLNEFAHLLCYRIERHPLDPPVARRTGNQFERVRVKAQVAAMLCVPSTKALIP